MSLSDRPAGQLPAGHWFLAEWPHVFLPGNRRICGHPLKCVGSLASRNRLALAWPLSCPHPPGRGASGWPLQ